MDVKRFDIYRKVPKDLTQPTLTGAIISICCVLFIVFLLLSELLNFLTVDVVSELYVADPDKTAMINVRINISTPHLQCQYLGLDIQDDMGRHEVGFAADTQKIALPEGGCRFESLFQIRKIPGNFHVSTHSAQMQPPQPNMQHVVHSVEFGDHIDAAIKSRGSFNPLEERVEDSADGSFSHDYILKVVPSTYEALSGEVIYAYQYTYLHRSYLAYSHHGASMPAIWFKYDLQPITVQYRERRKPFYTFLTTICAIVGGTFTVAGIIDGFVFSATEYYRKLEMGKLG